MVCRILRYYGREKAETLLDDFTSAVLAFAPESASRAEVTFLQAELNTLAHRLIKIETEVQLEHGETEEMQQSYHRYLYAARALQLELDQTGDAGRHADIENSLAKLVDQLEWLQPELAQEQIDDRVVAVWTSRLRSTFETLARHLDDARGDLCSTQRRVEREEPGRRTPAAAMLTTALSAISVALDKMNREAVEIRAEREAFESRLEKVRVDRLEHDPNITAALGTRSPGSKTNRLSSSSLRERLARLENPMASASAA